MDQEKSTASTTDVHTTRYRSGRRFVCLALDKLCAATGHVGGCWILNGSPLRHLWYWSSGVVTQLKP